MPGKHREPTISFRASEWERAIIEQRAALSGMHKKEFITRSCIYSSIVVVGKKENIQRIVDALQEMQITMKEIARQAQSGVFPLSSGSYRVLEKDFLALAITVADIADGAAYLFEKESVKKRKEWKAELELGQLRRALESGAGRADAIEKKENS